MKRVVSISLGTSKNNKKVQANFFGEEFEIERIGTDGDKARFRQLVAELDGKVDAFGVGGTDIYLYAGTKRYTWRDSLSLMANAKKTPFVDGSGLKHTLERETVAYLQDKGIVDFSKKSVLLVSAVDRAGMGEALSTRAKSVIYGDFLFGVGIPIPIRRWGTVEVLANLLLPIIARLPIEWFYPTGKKQEQNTPKYPQYFAMSDVIAGDFPLIRRYMPEDLRNKIILTNTTTEADVVELTRRGVNLLITTTPVLDGRSFGTNVMEGVLVTLLGKPADALTPQDYLSKLKELGWTPRVQELNPSPAASAVAATA